MRSIIWILFFQITLSLNLFSQSGKKMTAEKVIKNAITSMGGESYLHNVHSIYSDMITVMEGRKVHWITKEMLPNKGSFEIIYNGRTVYKSWFDGKEGFELVNGQKAKASEATFKDKPFKKKSL